MPVSAIIQNLRDEIVQVDRLACLNGDDFTLNSSLPG
jgi:hypothetical protein